MYEQKIQVRRYLLEPAKYVGTLLSGLSVSHVGDCRHT